MKPPPKRIKIGPYRYKVVADATALALISAKEGESLDGFCSIDQQRLYVNVDCDPGSARYTTLHEALHALLDLTGHADEWKKDDDAEEQFIVRFTPALLAFLRDNPKLIEYLTA